MTVPARHREPARSGEAGGPPGNPMEAQKTTTVGRASVPASKDKLRMLICDGGHRQWTAG